MPNTTTNLGLLQPLVNNPTDQDLWGGFLNTNFGNLDTFLLTCLNWTPSSQTSTITVTIPTAGSVTTGSAKTLYQCNATGGAFSANLPAVATASGLTVAFKKTDASANAITITGHSSDTIDGSNTFSLASQYQYVVLVCDGSTWNIVAQTSAAQVFSINSQNFTSGGTYTPTAGMSYCVVEMWGGGGGGGGVNTTTDAVGGGGGAGGYSRAVVTSGTIGASQTVTIGTGGTAGANTGGTGGTGGTTSVGSILTAAGGVGGGGGTSNANTGVAIGGAGGAGTVNGVTTQGASGGNSETTSNGNYNFSGHGGNTSLGGGGATVNIPNTAAGNNGIANSGGGGSGAAGTGSGLIGGVGGSGLVIITEYIT